uniref:Patatin class 1 n=1 Tax=Solanum tuberosum TaxID=4113 RepID=M1BAF9_SOLTU
MVTLLSMMLCGPKYDGKYLRNLIRGILGNRRLHETITHLLIPTYDIKTLEPQIFSSSEAKMDPGFDALLSDICIGTSSAPALLAMRPTGAKANLLPANVLDYDKYLVLSVGTGTSKSERKYDAAKWGLISWLYKDGKCPLVDAFTFVLAF